MLHQSMNSINPCVQFAVLEFQENFNHSIAQLLHTFPADHKTNEGTLFWSGPKRPPTPIVLNLENELHLDFVVAASNVLASTVGIPACRDRGQIKLIASTVKNTEFKPKEMKIKVDDKDTTREGAVDDEETVRQLVKELSQTSGTAASANLTPAAFEKDDDSNFHVDFIYAAANLRAQNYKIPEAEKHRVKMIAGKIIPAIATTTAMVMGLVTAELLKVVTLKSRKLEEFKNGFVNLALPLWLLSEPMPPTKTVSKEFDPIIQGPVMAKPEGFTSWDKVVVNIPDGTLKQFVDHLSDEQNVEVMIISAGNACLYNAYLPAHKKRLATKLTKVWEDVTKQTLSDKKAYLTIEVSASDLDTDTEVQLPTIKFVFR
jgi:ubiquitin-activating enzyme E1